MLMIRSNDARPSIYFVKPSAGVVIVRKKDLKNYKEGEIYAEVFFRIPDPSDPGEFFHENRTLDSIPEAIELYETELTKYNARKDARYENVYQTNKAYFDDAFLRKTTGAYRV